MSLSLTSLGSITPVEQGGTERFNLGYGVLIGNGQLPVITLEANGNGVLAFVDGQWIIQDLSGNGSSNFTANAPLSITNNTISFVGVLPVASGGTGVSSLPSGLLKSDGTAISPALASIDYVVPGFSVDGGIY